MAEVGRTRAGRGRGRRRPRRIGPVAAVALAALALTAAAGAAPAPAPRIPLGTALWFACTQPAFTGPFELRCRQPYDPRYAETFERGFDRFTPENEFKMAYLEPAYGRFDFALADRIAAFAASSGKTIRGHTLVWGEQLPPWVLRPPLLFWSRDGLASALTTYITTVVGHFAARFPGVVTEWDVVNEPLDDHGGLRPTVWERTLGPGYIRMALEAAHQADPAARRLINEKDAELPSRADALLALAAGLKAAGAPLDAVGFQSHVTITTAPSLATLVALWRRYAAAGLNVEVTELDVNDQNGVDDPVAKRDIYLRYAEACRLAGNCTGMTVWGVADRYSWLGPETDATLYDSEFAAKPAVSLIDTVLGRVAASARRVRPARPARPAARRRTRPAARVRLRGRRRAARQASPPRRRHIPPRDAGIVHRHP